MSPIAPVIFKKLYQQTRQARRAEIRAPSDDERKIYEQTKRAARARGLKFNLSEEDFALLVSRAQGRCEATGVPFDNRRPIGQFYRLHRFSIDRLSNVSGYSLPNVRLVTAQFNLNRGSATLQNLHIQKILYFAKMQARIDDPSILKRGLNAEDWQF